jgi:hypothetical protein
MSSDVNAAREGADANIFAGAEDLDLPNRRVRFAPGAD